MKNLKMNNLVYDAKGTKKIRKAMQSNKKVKITVKTDGDILFRREMKFPNEKELKKVRQKLAKSEGSLALSPTATPLEKLRHEICRQFIVYKREHGLKCKELAQLIGVDESVMSKILRYRNERFTTDKLIELLSKIYPRHHLILKVS